MPQSNSLAFDPSTLKMIGAHRSAVSSFDDHLLVWTQETGKILVSRLDETVLNAYVEAKLDSIDDELSDLIIVAANVNNSFVQIDPRDGEIETETDPGEHTVRTYVPDATLRREPADVAIQLTAHVEVWWNVLDADDEGTDSE